MQINIGSLKQNYNTDLNGSNIVQTIKSATKGRSFNVQQCCLNNAIQLEVNAAGLREKAVVVFKAVRF